MSNTIKPYNIDKLYSIVYNELNSEKAQSLNMQKYRAFVSGYGTALLICDPVKYINSLKNKSNETIQKELELTNSILEKMLEKNNRQDLLNILNKNNCNQLQQLLFKRDIQKYFSIIKESVYMMYNPSKKEAKNGK